MNLKELNFSKNVASTKIKNDVTVYSTIPSSEKIDLIQIALQKADEEGVYNEIKLDIYFHLNLVYLYTDLEIDDEDKQDELELYDILNNNGFIDEVIDAIGETEYKDLVDYLNETKEQNLKYNNTAAAVIRRIISDLPANAAAAKELLDEFNPEAYQEVMNFAAAANGGRPINQQTVPVSTAASNNVLNIQKAVKKD